MNRSSGEDTPDAPMAPDEAADAPGGRQRTTARPTRRAVLVAGGATLGAAALATAGALAIRANVSPVERLLATPSFRVAHRGGSLDWPEMSRFAYDEALAHRVDAIEISVSRTSDGVWFGLHDGTLDRTSGTSGFRAADHTWAEIEPYRITAAFTRDPSQPARPYAELTGLLDRFAGRVPVFVDPKSTAPEFRPELIRLLTARVTNAGSRLIAKSDGGSTGWARLARDVGMRSWGFYYGADIDANPAVLDTAKAWDLLGLDVGASDRAWAAIRAFGKPIIAHVAATRAQERRGLAHGAVGTIVSGVLETD